MGDRAPGLAFDEEGNTTSAYAELLSRVEIFANLDRVALARVAARLVPVSVPDGEAVFHQSEAADGLYVVTHGQFGIYGSAPDGPGEVRLSALTAGDVFGEMALLADEPRSATVVAEGDGEVLFLARGMFLKLLGQEPAVTRALGAILSRRLRAADRALQQTGLPVSTRGLAELSPDAVEQETPAAAETRARPAPGDGSRPISSAAMPTPPPARPEPLRPRWRADQSVIAIAAAGVILALGWIIPPPDGLSAAGWHALVTLTAIVPLLAVDALPEGVVALGLAAVWVIGGVADPSVALSGFASPNWVLVVSVLASGAAIASTGLLYRLALWAVGHTGGGFAARASGLAAAGLIVGPLVPNATGRVTLIAPATSELVDALGYEPGSRPAAGLAMATLVGFGLMVGTTLTSSSTAVLLYALLPERSRDGLNWLTWTLRAAPTHALLFLGMLGAVLWLYRPRADEGPATRPTTREPYGLALQRALLGAPSHRELLALGVAAALLVGFVTQPLHGVDAAWVAALALAALAATRVMAVDDLRAVNWSFALLFGILTSMAEVFRHVGLDLWLGALAATALGGVAGSPVLFVAALTLLSYAISLALRWQAAAPLVTIAIGPVAAGAGIDPWVVALVALIACNGFFLPYQSTVYLALYHGSGGRLFTHRQARPAAFAFGVVTLFALCASVPVWHAMGLV